MPAIHGRIFTPAECRTVLEWYGYAFDAGSHVAPGFLDTKLATMLREYLGQPAPAPVKTRHKPSPRTVEIRGILHELREMLDDTRGPIDVVRNNHNEAVNEAVVKLLEVLSDDGE